jgi:hypothetical protein
VSDVRTTAAVRYQRVADRWYLPLCWWLWVVLAVPYLAARFAVTDWSSGAGAACAAVEALAMVVAASEVGILRSLWIPAGFRAVGFRAAGFRAGDEPAVDCLVPTHREEAAIVASTVIAAGAIRGIRDVVVLGNFERAEIHALCRRLGVRYVVRGSNEHAKAGNLNHGLRHTDAPFVLVLDADHVAVPDLLERTMGHFDDAAVAFVQSPQAYRNTDGFLFRPQHGRSSGWNEQQPFYYGWQPGLNRLRVPLFTGASAVLRRAALDQIGGFAEGTIAEDVHTSLRLHRSGWRSVFVPEPLAFGIEARSFRDYQLQRHRWAGGAFNLLLRSRDSPLRAAMPLPVRLAYLALIGSYLSGLCRLGVLLVPPLLVFGGGSPVSVAGWLFGPVAAGWWLFSGWLTLSLYRGAADARYRALYGYARMFALASAVVGLVIPYRRFVSSRKSAPGDEPHWAKPALRICLAVAVASAVGAVLVAITGRATAPVYWAGVLAAGQGLILARFLTDLRRFERRSGTGGEPADPSGESVYRQTLDRWRAGQIGAPYALRCRPLRPIG